MEWTHARRAAARLCVIGVLLIAAAGCDVFSTEPLRGVEVDTDRDAYGLDAAITVRIHNASSRNAWFHHCDHRISMAIESQSGAGWNEVLSIGVPCQAIYESGVLLLRRGEDQTGTFSLESAGTYRIRVLTGPTADAVGFNVVYSDAFQVG